MNELPCGFVFVNKIFLKKNIWRPSFRLRIYDNFSYDACWKHFSQILIKFDNHLFVIRMHFQDRASLDSNFYFWLVHPNIDRCTVFLDVEFVSACIRDYLDSSNCFKQVSTNFEILGILNQCWVNPVYFQNLSTFN